MARNSWGAHRNTIPSALSHRLRISPEPKQEKRSQKSRKMAGTLISNPFLCKNPSAVLSTAKKVNEKGWSPVTISCRKKEVHPEFHDDAKVYCNGELVMTTGGTKKEYIVDVWSGNHPFYLGSRSGNLFDADQVEKFRKKYSGLSEIMQIPVLKGEIVIPPRRKSGAKGGKKK